MVEYFLVMTVTMKLCDDGDDGGQLREVVMMEVVSVVMAGS